LSGDFGETQSPLAESSFSTALFFFAIPRAYYHRKL
jgi:hypothetical protein